jgi:multidrug efflux system outer membrane protein
VTSPENSSQVGIEEFFDDPMLTSLIDQALVGNQELEILAEDIRIASNAAGRRGDGDQRRVGDGPRAPVDGPN